MTKEKIVQYGTDELKADIGNGIQLPEILGKLDAAGVTARNVSAACYNLAWNGKVKLAGRIAKLAMDLGMRNSPEGGRSVQDMQALQRCTVHVGWMVAVPLPEGGFRTGYMLCDPDNGVTWSERDGLLEAYGRAVGGSPDTDGMAGNARLLQEGPKGYGLYVWPVPCSVQVREFLEECGRRYGKADGKEAAGDGHCLIAVYSDEGKCTYRCVSCSGDGNPDAVRKALLGHYNSQELAETLVAGGDIERLDEPADLLYCTSESPGAGPRTDTSKSDIFSWYDPVEVGSEDALTGAAEESMVSWIYLFIGGCWFYRCSGKGGDSWHRLY